MGVWVAERAKAIVVFLAGRIPQCEFNVFSVNLYIRNVVLKDGGDINLVESCIMEVGERGKDTDTDLWECSFREDYQQASLRRQGDEVRSRGIVAGNAYLSTSTVAYDDEFSSDFCHCCWWWSESSSSLLTA